jgi:2-polyprenyl-3-methyl-5-hydroxy-6-metoxy-1,4-benzoquinol methylase
MDRESHWETTYRAKSPTEVSWYTPHLAESLRLIEEVVKPEAKIIDVGGGASTLVDDLLAAGYQNVTVLDISGTALELASERLGERAQLVNWIRSDVTTVELASESYDAWHDRAVFHFLLEEGDRKKYVANLARSLVAGGYAVIGTFAPSGPERCSGLDVRRYDASTLHAELGDAFELGTTLEMTHVTPGGKPQRFAITRFRKRLATRRLGE